MAKFKTIDLLGQRFERLVVIKLLGLRGRENYWLCKCDCGGSIEVRASHLKTGNIRSCGCIRRERGRKMLTTHGLSDLPEHPIWWDMIERCYCETHHAYKDYMGRGIEVCQEWRDSFANFIADMGRRPHSKLQLDRIDNNGNYCKENCRWATIKQQAGNKRSNVWLEYKSEKMIMVDWAERWGITRSKLHKLLKRKQFEDIAKEYELNSTNHG